MWGGTENLRNPFHRRMYTHWFPYNTARLTDHCSKMAIMSCFFHSILRPSLIIGDALRCHQSHGLLDNSPTIVAMNLHLEWVFLYDVPIFSNDFPHIWCSPDVSIFPHFPMIFPDVSKVFLIWSSHMFQGFSPMIFHRFPDLFQCFSHIFHPYVYLRWAWAWRWTRWACPCRWRLDGGWFFLDWKDPGLTIGSLLIIGNIIEIYWKWYWKLDILDICLELYWKLRFFHRWSMIGHSG